MISWMQQHKKYLIVTIWVSTIAFVGAGFVGWGGYEYGRSSNSVAQVGKKEITTVELNKAYSNMFEYYNKIYGGNLSKEDATKMGLEKVALQNIINEKLLESYADELKIRVTDSEVNEHINKMEVFAVGGVFNKDTYLQTLSANGIHPKDFEDNIRKSILVSKVQNLFAVKSTDYESTLLGGAFHASDRLAYKILEPKDVTANITEDEVKKFWNSTKDNYKSEELFDVDVYEMPVKKVDINDSMLMKYYQANQQLYRDANSTVAKFEVVKEKVRFDMSKEETKKEALKMYVAFKKGEVNATNGISKTPLSRMNPVIANAINQNKKIETLKPIDVGMGFVIAKIKHIEPPKQLNYEESKMYAATELKRQKVVEALKQKAVVEAKNFQGKDIGFVARGELDKLTFLTKEEAKKLLDEVFASKNEIVTVFLPTKVVLVKILEQKLLVKDKEFINSTTLQIKDRLLYGHLLEYLQGKYKVVVYNKL
jgi:peptidyl-prolyl cis-trans isomerase D